MWWWLVAAALAGQVRVDARDAVVVQVDGREVAWSPKAKAAIAPDVPAGVRGVRVLDRSGKALARLQIEVPERGEVRLRYDSRGLTLVGPPVVEEPPVEEEPPAEAPVPRGIGSVLVAGVGAGSGRVWIGERAVAYSPAHEGFPLGGLKAGTHALRIEENGRVRVEGRIDVEHGKTRRCLPQGGRQGWTLDCHWVDGLVDQPEPPEPEPEPEPEPDTPVAPRPIGAADFAALTSSVSNAAFSSDKLNVVRGAASHHHFTIQQLGAVIDLLSFSSDKVEAARILRPVIVDPENAYLLDGHLSFSSDKAAVQALFAKPAP